MSAVMHSKASPFHAGEQEMQERAGVREQTESLGQRMIRDFMPDQHREFYSELPFIVLATLDATGQPWASLVTGDRGFISSPDPKTLVIDAKILAGDPLADNLVVGADVGLLGIAPDTRRRNRMTGKIAALDDSGIRISVTQAFGNCPMYIQKRELIYRAEHSEAHVEAADQLDDRDRQLIESADTFFIASHFTSGANSASDGADASHRGGRPGFVRVAADGTLVFPDFTGNGHFNTLGNLLLNPKTGLVFFDFDNGDMLYVAGKAEIVWEGDDLEAFEGALRLVRVKTEKRIRTSGALPLRWSFEEFSPFIEPTGTWTEVDEIKKAEQARNQYRKFVVARIERESETVKSFYLEPVDDAGLACYKPGQFLPIKVDLPGQSEPVTRTYTISDAPGSHFYRLSIKREPARSDDFEPGLVSNFFHDHIAVGSKIEAMAPRGHFVLDTESDRPVVLLSAGVGITPMISMLNCMARRFATCGKIRDVWFLHGARNSSELAFSKHLHELEAAMPHKTLHISFSNPSPDDRIGATHHGEGQITIDTVKRLLPLDDYEYYLCGPPGFMKAMYEGLKRLNIGDERIHYEFFGPATVLAPRAPQVASDDVPVGEPVKVRFQKSNIDADWDTGKGTLLEFAEAQGIDAAYSCRSGACSTCSVKVLDGDVQYLNPPVVETDEGHALICSAVPSDKDKKRLTLDL